MRGGGGGGGGRGGGGAAPAPGGTERAGAAAMADKTGEPSRDDLDSDDDALAAYNRWLAKMAEHDR